MSTVDNPNSVMYVPPVLRAARRLVYDTALKSAGKWVPLEQIAVINMGQSPDGRACTSEPIGAPLLNGPTEFGTTCPIPVQWTSEPKKYAEPGDLLFCVRGATAGRTNWADQQYAIGRGLCAVRGKPDRGYTKFIYHMLRDRRDVLADQAHGSTFMNLSKEELHQLAIPQISIENQRKLGDFLTAIEQDSFEFTIWNRIFDDTPYADMVRIVARIEVLAGRVAEAQRLRVEAMKEGDALVASESYRIFQRLFNEDKVSEIGSIVTFRNDLIRPIDGKTGQQRFVGLQHIESHSGRKIGEDWVLAEDLQGRKFKFSAGEIVYGYLRPYLNKVWIADGDGLCSVDQYVLRVKPELINTNYLAYFMRSPHFLQKANEFTHNLMLPRLRSGFLESIKIPLPSIFQQEKVVKVLESLQLQSQTIKDLQSATQTELDALLPAILDKAFRGEL